MSSYNNVRIVNLQMRARRYVLVLLVAGSFGPAVAEGRELADEEMESIVAGSVDQEIQDELLRFSYVGSAGASHTAELEGTLSLSGRPRSGAPSGLLVIDNGAQTDLRSLVNINAVNSNVNVLLNLNIIIDSSVRDIRQINIRSE